MAIPAVTDATVVSRMTELHLLFSLGSDRYALAAKNIVRVLPRCTCKRLPEAPAWVVGVFTHAAAVVPVIDLGLRVLGRAAADCTSTRLVLVHYPGGRTLGLVLEQVHRLERLQVAGQTGSGIARGSAQYLGTVQPHSDALVQRIEVAGLLPGDVAALLFPQDAAP